MSTPQEKNDIAQLFTNTEKQALRIWFDLDSNGHDVEADQMLQDGLQLEHFQSRLDDVVANRSQLDLAKMAELEQAFQNRVDLSNGILLADKKKQTTGVTLTQAQFNQAAAFFGWEQK